ncbi:phage portal protein [Lacticaseibacillus kribbianus]|uniref:phage portal protein n=1 Tax=Lacticaseibacillus kribbianus TaxID=2926292 RepID=UPI001CD412BD|nr:phage portal protein [Lacticaseibacillus kribbianus]
MFGLKRKTEKRSTPTIVQLGSPQWSELLQTSGYTRLADNPDVQSAVNTIAELVSSMSIHLLENTDKGDKRVNNELSRLIDVSPSKGMTRKTWLTKIVRDLYLYGDGNSLCQIVVQPGSEYLSELRPLDMANVSYIYDSQTADLRVRYGDKEMDSAQLVHFLINPDPRYPLIGNGFDTILSTTLNNLAQAAKTKSVFMSGKYMPNIIIKVDSDSDALSSDEGRTEVKNKYIGHSDGLEPWIIPADLLEVQQVKPLTLQDIALNEGIEIDKKTVAGLFGVPAFLLGVGDFNREEYNNFVNTRIAGLGQMIAQALTRDVLISSNWYFRFNPRSLYQYDLAELVNAGKEMVDRTAMRRNEWRGWVGLPPDDDMESLITLENYVPTAQLGDQAKLKGGDSNGEKNQSDENG